MTAQVHDAQRVAAHLQRRRRLQHRAHTHLTVAQRLHFVQVQPPTKAQRVVRVLVQDRIGEPGVAAHQAVQRRVLARVLERAAARLHRRHVAGLAGEEARRAVGVVGGGIHAHRRVVGVFDGALLQIGRQRRERVHPRGLERARLGFAERALDDAILEREVVEPRLLRHRPTQLAAEAARREWLLRAVVVREVAGHRVRHVVARAAHLARAHELRLQRGVVVGVAIRPVPLGPRPQHRRAAAGVGALGRAAVVREERRRLRADVLGVIGVHERVAHGALDAIGVARCQGRPVGRRRASLEPAARRMAAQTEVARAGEVLLRNRHRRPEHRVARGVRHRAAAPYVHRFDRGVELAMARIAARHVAEAGDLTRLRAGQLHVGGRDGRDEEQSERHEGQRGRHDTRDAQGREVTESSQARAGGVSVTSARGSVQRPLPRHRHARRLDKTTPRPLARPARAGLGERDARKSSCQRTRTERISGRWPGRAG